MAIREDTEHSPSHSHARDVTHWAEGLLALSGGGDRQSSLSAVAGPVDTDSPRIRTD